MCDYTSKFHPAATYRAETFCYVFIYQIKNTAEKEWRKILRNSIHHIYLSCIYLSKLL